MRAIAAILACALFSGAAAAQTREAQSAPPPSQVQPAQPERSTTGMGTPREAPVGHRQPTQAGVPLAAQQFNGNAARQSFGPLPNLCGC